MAGRPWGTLFAGISLLGVLLACKGGGDKCATDADCKNGFRCVGEACVPNAVTAPEQATAAPAVAPPTAASGEVAAHEPARGTGGTGYPMDGIQKIADNCSAASVTLAVVTSAVVDKWESGKEWTWATQAFLANQQFQLIDDAPTKPGDVKILQHHHGKGDDRALVAYCIDGGTCNRVAAMYKHEVYGAKPTPFCGDNKLVKGPGETLIQLTQVMPVSEKLPKRDDPTGLCARLHVCKRKLDHSAPDDLGIRCNRAPSKHKVECARKPTCQEVVDCAG